MSLFRPRRNRGQAATEFTLLCAVVAAALLLPWAGEAPAVTWLRAWGGFLESASFWLADG